MKNENEYGVNAAGTYCHTVLPRGEGLSSQRVGCHKVVYMDPVHPGQGVPKTEAEQPALHVPLG